MKKRIAVVILAFMMIINSSYVAFGASQDFDVPVPEYEAAKNTPEDANEILAYANGQGLLNGVYFNDITNSPNKESITRLAALGVIKMNGDSDFRPSDNVTGYEALAFLVSMIGQDQQVLQAVLPNSQGMSEQALKSLFNETYLNQALAAGIITQDEQRELYGPVERERLAMWTARALNMQPTYTDMSTVYSYSDWDKVDPSYRGLIETLVQARVFPPKNDGTFAPSEDMSRGEMVQVIENGLATIYANQNMVNNFGLIVGIENTRTSEPGNVINTKTITVKNTDGTYTNLVTNTESKGNKRRDFVTYKNGVVSSANNLSVGDNIEYITVANEVKYAEVLTDGTILDKMNAVGNATTDSFVYFGKVSEIINEQNWKDGKYVGIDRIRVVNYSGDVHDLVVTEDLTNGTRNDIITYKDDKVGGVKLLAEGDSIEYMLNSDKNVVYIRVGDLEKKYISGTVRYVTDNEGFNMDSVNVFGYDNQVYNMPVAQYGTILMNDRYATLKDFQYGMHATLTVVNGYVVKLAGESFSDPGHIPKYGKMRMGTVYTKYTNGVMLEMDDGRKEYYKIPSSVPTFKEAAKINFFALKTGDKLKMYFDDIYTNIPSRIEVEPEERLIKQIYKGSIAEVNSVNRTITIREPYYLTNTNWKPDDSYQVTLTFDEKAKIYNGNYEVLMEDLERDFSNDTIYIVVEDSYGVDEGVMATIKQGGETLSKGSVHKQDAALSKFELTSRENFDYTDGTIVVKDGRLIPISTIKNNDDVFVVSDSFGIKRRANVVQLLTPEDSIFDTIRIGAIETINPSSFNMTYHASVSDNAVNAVNKYTSIYFPYYTQSVITNVTDPENHVKITNTQFFNGSYSKSENKVLDNVGVEYERYYAFAVVNSADNSIIAMNLRYNGLMPNQNIDDNVTQYDQIATKLNNTFNNARFTRGLVYDKDLTWNRVLLTDSNEWSKYSGQWVANTSNIYVEYTDAIIIKNNKVITHEDLEKGDYLYIMRINEDALVIFVD